VVDIGANRGQFALDVLSVLSDVEVLSFEPLKSEFRILERVLQSESRAHLRNQALGSSSGEAVVHVARAADSSSLLSITPAQAATFPGTDEVRQERVNISTLEKVMTTGEFKSLFREPALLKVDVQGYELEVLRGAGDWLRRFSWIYVEISFVELYERQPLAYEVIRFLDSAGFVLSDLGVPTMLNGRAIQFDALFERS
jgi:FkbM family methyltransferase